MIAVINAEQKGIDLRSRALWKYDTIECQHRKVMVPKDSRARVPSATTRTTVAKPLKKDRVPIGCTVRRKVVARPNMVEDRMISITRLDNKHGELSHVLIVVETTPAQWR